jgi:hypothetical protein
MLDSGLQAVPLDEMSLGTDAHKQKPGHLRPPAENKFAEIFIFGEQQSAVIVRAPYYFSIGSARCHLCDVEYIMACAAEPADQARIDAFICEPAHASDGQR